MKRRVFLRFSLLSLVLFLSSSCKTPPSAPEDILGEVPAEEKPEADAEEPAASETPGETPEFALRAEEVIEPVDKNPHLNLPEPSYDLSEPEVIAVLEEAPPARIESAAPMDEAVEKPPEEAAPVESAGQEAIEPESTEPEAIAPETAVTEAETETETLSEIPADETEDAPPPPPPPAAALRPSETPAPPPVSRNPPEPVRAQPVLPARNPPTETEKYQPPPAGRMFHVQMGKTFEVPFDGTGWVYTGEENSKNGVSYDSRRVYDESQVFVFRADKEGDYTLMFYKQDFLRDYVTTEYARVLVTDEAPPIETAALPEAAGDASDETAQSASGAPEPAETGDLLQEAREAVAAQRYADAINSLDRFRQRNPAMNDEAWWLYGQAFEASSPARDILSALDAYSAIVRDYPQSRYYKNAQNRIAFLNKFYLNIR